MREYIQRCKRAEPGSQVAVTRQVLLNVAGVTSKRADKANASLSRVLDALLGEKVLESYQPSPLPLGAMEIVILRWSAEQA